MGTVGGTAKIHFWIEHLVTAITAFMLTVILEKFYHVSAFRALILKYILTAPVTAVLSGALHMIPLPGYIILVRIT
jgi:hypothetical protein